jgi:hypothetical protein
MMMMLAACVVAAADADDADIIDTVLQLMLESLMLLLPLLGSRNYNLLYLFLFPSTIVSFQLLDVIFPKRVNCLVAWNG